MVSHEQIHKVMQLFVPPPQPGERIVVNGWEDIQVIVSGIEWVPEDSCCKINLDWGEFGNSYVFLHDEEKTWRRFLEVN